MVSAETTIQQCVTVLITGREAMIQLNNDGRQNLGSNCKIWNTDLGKKNRGDKGALGEGVLIQDRRREAHLILSTQ